MATAVESMKGNSESGILVTKAARSALVQRRRGAGGSVRELYYQAHSLLRTLRHYLPRAA